MAAAEVVVSSSDVLKCVAPALAIGLVTLAFVIFLVVGEAHTCLCIYVCVSQAS